MLAAALGAAGFPVTAADILTAPAVAAGYLRERYPGVRCLLLNSGQIAEDLAGVTLIGDDDPGREFGRHRGHTVLQPAEHPAGGRREPVVDVAGELADLHQHALHRAERVGDVLRGAQREVITELLALLTGLIFGLVPALQVALTVALHDSLKDGSRGSSHGKRRAWLREAMVVSEVVFACVLLVGSGLLMRSFLRVLDVTLGYRPASTVALRIDPSSRYARQAQRNAYFDEALRRAAYSASLPNRIVSAAPPGTSTLAVTPVPSSSCAMARRCASLAALEPP